MRAVQFLFAKQFPAHFDVEEDLDPGSTNFVA